MKAKQIVNQIKSLLPLYTDAFSTSISLTSLVSSSNVVTATTASAHGLTTGNAVVIRDAVISNPITSLTQVDGVASAVTQFDHDKTPAPSHVSDSRLKHFETATITGANEVLYNVTDQRVTAIEGANLLKFQVNSTASSPDSGSPVLEQRFINSRFNGAKVVTVVNDTTFTYNTTLTPDTTATGTPSLIATQRIARSTSIDRAIEAYTKQDTDDLWAFVVLGDRFVNKDRHVATDANAQLQTGTDFRQLLIAPFLVYVIQKTTNSIAGAQARDNMEDVLPSLLKALYGAQLSSQLTDLTNFKIGFSGHGTEAYNTAYYVHRFEFEAQEYLNNDDAVEADSQALQCIDFDIETAQTTTSTNKPPFIDGSVNFE